MRALTLILILAAALLPTGCAHHEKSGWRIIEDEEKNPMITFAPAHAGERVRKEGEPRR